MNFLRKFTIILGGLCLVTMTMITCADVMMRYFFNDPIFGSGEMVQLLLSGAVFSGMFAVTLDRGHVNVSLFEPVLLTHFRRGYRSIFDTMSVIGVVSITAILGWKTWDLTIYPEETVVLQIPMILVVGTMTMLSFLSIIGALAAMWMDRGGMQPHSQQSFE